MNEIEIGSTITLKSDSRTVMTVTDVFLENGTLRAVWFNFDKEMETAILPLACVLDSNGATMVYDD